MVWMILRTAKSLNAAISILAGGYCSDNDSIAYLVQAELEEVEIT